MTEFSTYVASNWQISESIAAAICEAFERGDSVFYLSDYEPQISAETDINLLSEIYEALSNIQDMAPKRKRLLNALSKAGALSEELEHRIETCTNSVELDDMLLPFRGNQRTKAQTARDKGLSPLADVFYEQESGSSSSEELASPFVNSENGLPTVDSVLEGVADILAEKFAYDETLRSILRDFAFDEGYFEVIPKDKKDRRFAQYRNKTLPVGQVEHEEYLTLVASEADKSAKLKFCVPLFQVSELLREHFVTNPDFAGNETVSKAIDEAWTRLLEPILERDVKRKLLDNAERTAMRRISGDIMEKFSGRKSTGSILAVGNIDGKNLVLVATSANGKLLGATNDKVNDPAKPFTSVRVKQFVTRYHPGSVLVLENTFTDSCVSIIEKTLHDSVSIPQIIRFAPETSAADFNSSEWMKHECQHLDASQVELYAISLRHLLPLGVVAAIGVEHFVIHADQHKIRPASMSQLLLRIITLDGLRKGILPIDSPDSVLANIPEINPEILADIRKHAASKQLTGKLDLFDVHGVTEQVFNNIAGYTVVPSGENPLDKTLVHPKYYGLVEGMAEELGVSVVSLIQEPELLKTFEGGELYERLYVDRKLTEQLRAGQIHLASSISAKPRRIRISDLAEGQVLTGKVSNLTAFGAFVNIGAECDGLVHISELADDYVDKVEQIVGTGDVVDVRVVKIDTQNRRVSLSMKGLGSSRKSKSRASSAQLHTLAEHFNANR